MAKKWALHSTKAKYVLFSLLIIFVLCAFVRVIFLRQLWISRMMAEQNGAAPVFSDEEVSGRNSTKLILFWTRRSGRRNWFSFPDEEASRSLAWITACSQQNCIFTSDHTRQKQADVLLFYLSDRPRWPSVRYAHQYYAHFIHEAPGSRTPHSYLDQYEGNINITINFRRDADLYLPYYTVTPIDTNKEYKWRIALTNKTKMAVWPVSHCKTESRREDYIAELSKYIDVDMFGDCGKRKCSRTGSHTCLKNWERTHKFYLSFENNVCEDYITEKVYLPLEYEIIPVVFGGANYTRDTPPHSVINARDFNSPRDLADFLIRLAADEQRYRSYFKWKTHYNIAGGVPQFLCKLCESLHANEFPVRLARARYADYWYGKNGEKCDNELMSRLRKLGHW